MATPIIELILGEQWLPAVPYLEILAFQGISISLEGVNYNAIASIGRSKSLFQATIIKRCVSVVLLVEGMYLGGIKGILWGMTLSSYFICLYNSALVHKYIGYSLTKQFFDLLPIIATNILTYFLTYLLLINIDSFSYNIYLIVLITYIILYFLISIIFKISVLNNLKEFIVKLKQ
ncbi:MAG: polysaccharide biosynthesis C-terminal domain-containing protein [Bacteroidaceae bacterium]|nr:polysaccharide biosynthesis C-terminal domain-containing protein [Bacteroidaceae bacterium]